MILREAGVLLTGAKPRPRRLVTGQEAFAGRAQLLGSGLELGEHVIGEGVGEAAAEKVSHVGVWQGIEETQNVKKRAWVPSQEKAQSS
jgi:hypothetical protein